MTDIIPEFSRAVRIDTLGAGARSLHVEADEKERSALAERFGLIAIDRLEADVELTRAGEIVRASGTLRALVTQSCVATAEPVPASLEEAFALNFAPPPEPAANAEEEIELSDADCDTIFYSGSAVDVGEAVAETLSLSLDPWPRAPGAEEVLRKAGVKSEEEVEETAGPFAALAGLKGKLK